MGNHKKYWKSELELSSDNPTINDLKNNEFVNELPADAFQNSENSLEDSSTNRRAVSYTHLTLPTNREV